MRIINLSFDPASVTVQTGAAVIWTNEDAPPHTVTSVDGIFDSGVFDPGASFTWTFDQPGSFPYVCQLHPQMQGTVIVEGEATAEAASAAPAGAESTTGSQQAAATSDHAVSIVDFAFEPATIDATTGSTVVWTNDGQAPHTVTGDFADSGILEPGQTFSHTFAEEGEFGYACAIHPEMVGTVRVTAAQAAPAQATPVAAQVDGPRGIWLISLTPDDESLLGAQQALVTFDEGGMAEADFAAAPGTGTPANTLTIGRGEWAVQNDIIRLALVAFVNDANERFAGTVTIHAQGQLDSTGRTIDGTFDFTLADTNGESARRRLGNDSR